MAIDQATVRKIASLARIAISDAEAAAMEGELNGILGWVEQLGQVAVTGVEPMTAVIPNTLSLRVDLVDADPLPGDGPPTDVLANPPGPQPGVFGVPQFHDTSTPPPFYLLSQKV